MSTVITTTDPCPFCLMQNNVNNPLQDRPGQFYTSCRAGHKFEDTEELNVLRQQARAKFPNLYKGPDAPPQRDPQELAAMGITLDPNSKKAIEELSGQTITGAADLKGIVFAYIRDNEDKENEIKRLRASVATMRSRPGATAGSAASLGPNQFVVTIPEWAEAGAAEQANHAGLPLDTWMSQEMDHYFETFFGGTGGR